MSIGCDRTTPACCSPSADRQGDDVGLPKLARLSRLKTSTRSSSAAADAADGTALIARRRPSADPVRGRRRGRCCQGAGRLQHERRRIEPLIGPAEHGTLGREAWREIGTISADVRRQRRRPLRARAVVLDEHRQRLTAAHRGDGRQLPAAQQRAGDAGPVRANGTSHTTLVTQLCGVSQSAGPLL